MEIWTGQLAKWRRFNELNLEIVDTTVKSGIAAFAPSWDIVQGSKSGTLSEAEYTRIYYEMLRASWRENRAEWNALLAKPRFVLCCYCSPGKFCHRHILKDVVVRMARRQGTVIADNGEWGEG